jgi:hypothetical protein
MSVNLSGYIGKGMQPKQFVESMTKNQDKFLDWYKRFSWDDAGEREFFRSFGRDHKSMHCFILAADWCGDVVRNVPVVFRVLEEMGMSAEVLIMEQHLEVMDQFLTMGGRSIPIVLFTDKSGDVLAKWGPRPAYVQEPMVEFKQRHPDKDAPGYDEELAAVRAEILARYGTDTRYQRLIVNELKQALEAVAAEVAAKN